MGLLKRITTEMVIMEEDRTNDPPEHRETHVQLNGYPDKNTKPPNC